MDQDITYDEVYAELDSKDSPLRHIGLNELQVKLNEAMQKLSLKHRTVVVMHDIEGIPHDEIAKIVGVSVGTIRSRLFYARRQLQADLGEYI